MSDEDDDMDTLESGETMMTSPVSESSGNLNPTTPMTPTTPKTVVASPIVSQTEVTIKEEIENSDEELDGDKLDDDKKVCNHCFCFTPAPDRVMTLMMHMLLCSSAIDIIVWNTFFTPYLKPLITFSNTCIEKCIYFPSPGYG